MNEPILPQIQPITNPKIKDITGQRFGELTVLGFSHTSPGCTYWVCLCSCGKTTTIERRNLGLAKNKRVASCGCMKSCPGYKVDDTIVIEPGMRIRNLKGVKSGKLTAVSFSHKKLVGDKMKQHLFYWNCICECGQTSKVSATFLFTGKVRSCGCANANWIKKGHASTVLTDKGSIVTDLSGLQFGYLTVDRFDKSVDGAPHWICICGCGKSTSVSTANLTKKTRSTASCGCGIGKATFDGRDKIMGINGHFILDITGQQFDRLTAIRPVPGRSRSASWLCECSCGNTIATSANSLVLGKSRSCGCRTREAASERMSAEGLHKLAKSWRYQWFVSVNGQRINLRSSYEMIYAQHLIDSGIGFEYEPKIFTLAPAIRYIPDFYLPSTDTWVEVKGRESKSWPTKRNMFIEQGNNLEVITIEGITPLLGGICYMTWYKRNAHKYLR